MIEGRVKWFNEGKGFGFITSGDKDYFVHFKEIQKEGFKTLVENERVQFEAGMTSKGAVATNVKPV